MPRLLDNNNIRPTEITSEAIWDWCALTIFASKVIIVPDSSFKTRSPVGDYPYARKVITYNEEAFV